MVVNPDKFQVNFLGNQNRLNLLIDGINTPSSDTVKLLGVIIDKKLEFNPYITDICSKKSK